jgi:hypothetical protein
MMNPVWVGVDGENGKVTGEEDLKMAQAYMKIVDARGA